jgi:CSLREA domain-containing protein
MRVLKTLLPAVVLLLLAAPAQAATFNVNSLADGPDASSADGICATSGGVCTLRAAVEQSASTGGADDIVLGPGAHALSSGLSISNHDVTIRGAGARATTIEGVGSGHRVLSVSDTTTQIRDLRITGGSTGPGAGLWVSGTGSVLVERVAITDNHTSLTGGTDYGGGISKLDAGSLTIRSSVVSANSVLATSSNPTHSARGGGILHGGGALTIVNTTIEGNTATGNGLAGAFGGGLYSSGGTATLRNVTLARNSVAGPNARGGNLAADFTGQVTVENAIVAQGTAPSPDTNCYRYTTATITPVGRNIDSGSSCAFGAPHLSNTSAALGPLANNGGPTDTLLPTRGSAAIDAAIGCPPSADDQRGVGRPAGAACDIGAVERVPEAVGPGGPPPPDLVAPIVRDFVISARRFRAGRATRRTRALPRSTHFVFHLSEPSLVDFLFDRRAAGRRGPGGSCRRPSRRNRRGRRCVRWLAAGALADNLSEGTQSLRFDGGVTLRGRGRKLGAGFYRVRIEAVDRAGNRSRPVTGGFQIVR